MYVTKQHFMQNCKERQDGNPIKADQKSFKAVYKETYYLQPLVTE